MVVPYSAEKSLSLMEDPRKKLELDWVDSFCPPVNCWKCGRLGLWFQNSQWIKFQTVCETVSVWGKVSIKNGFCVAIWLTDVIDLSLSSTRMADSQG